VPCPLTNPSSWIATLSKRRISTPPAPASGARYAVGRHARMTVGRVAVGIAGTLSTPEEFTPPAPPVDFNPVPLVQAVVDAFRVVCAMMKIDAVCEKED
jgi:hypothetical protein